MGGNGGHSGFDISKMRQAAEERLRQLAQAGTRILFACEPVDRKSLDSNLQRSKVFLKGRCSVLDSYSTEQLEDAVRQFTVIIVYTSSAKTAPFIDLVVESAVGLKKQGINVIDSDKALIPQKVTTYRWPTLAWDEVEKMFQA